MLSTYSKMVLPVINMKVSMGLLIKVITLSVLLTACSEESPNLALGTLERDRITLSATAAELITALPIAEGSSVQAGDLLVQLDDRLQLSLVLKAEADVHQFQAVLDKLISGARVEEVAAARARVAAARASLVESEQDYERTRKLAEDRLIAQADLETAEARRDNRKAVLEDAEEQLRQLTNGSREEDLRQAEAFLQAANAILQREQQNLANLSITATRDGVLDSLPWNVGERVFMGSPLVIMLADELPFARVYIPETVRANIRVGDTFPVYVDGVDTPFTGTVNWVSIEPAFTPYYALNSEERSRLMYLAELRLNDAARSLPSGLPVQMELP